MQIQFRYNKFNDYDKFKSVSKMIVQVISSQLFQEICIKSKNSLLTPILSEKWRNLT